MGREARSRTVIYLKGLGAYLRRDLGTFVPLLFVRIHPKLPEEISILSPEATKEAFTHSSSGELLTG